MKGLVIASHGEMALGTLDTIKLFFSDLKQVEALALRADDNPDEFVHHLEETIEKVDTGDGVVVAVDLLGGSPCNCSARILSKHHIDVITGMNLPMLMEFLSLREHSHPDIHQMIHTGQEGLTYLNELFSTQSDDDE